MLAEVTASSSALFAAGVILFEVVLWYTAKWVWALGLWKNDRNIARREAKQRALYITEEA